MRVIKIEEEKKEKLSEYTEKILKSAGKLMQCLESLDGGGYGERDDEDWEDDDDDMGMRGGGRVGGGSYGNRGGYGMRRSRRTGRYM